jgi:hypothetical protein
VRRVAKEKRRRSEEGGNREEKRRSEDGGYRGEKK